MKPLSIWVRGLAIATVCILLTFMPTPQSLVFGQSSDNELSQDIAELDSFLSNRDLDSIEATVDKQSAKWRERDRSSFVIYMTNACNLLSSYDIGDVSKRGSLLSRYAISVLTSGELPLEEQVRFVEFTIFVPLVTDEPTWKTLRKQTAELSLGARRRVESTIDPTFDFNDRPFLNVPPPAGSGVPAGASPESIKNDKLRAEYERAIALNSEKIRRSNEQIWLKSNAPQFYQEVERYLVSAYSRPPADPAELERLLAQYVNDNEVRAQILQQVSNASR